jgi:hypothetical protein
MREKMKNPMLVDAHCEQFWLEQPQLVGKAKDMCIDPLHCLNLRR